MRALSTLLCLVLGAALAACGAAQRPVRVASSLAPTAQEASTAEATPAEAPTVLADLGAGQSITLKLGERASLGSGGASVIFERVVEDSRCPSNAQCLWQGRVVIAGSVTLDGQSLPFTLGTLKGFADAPASFSAGPYTLSIDAVEPYPETPEGIADEDYLLTLAVDS